MRPQKVNDEKLIEGLLSIFRNKGYEGASLNELAGSIGLQKASLYHRFPGGKKEMAEVVLQHVAEWVGIHIINVLIDSNRKPKTRLDEALINIKTFYKEGQNNCLFKALSMEPSLNLFIGQLKMGMERWVNAFEVLATDFGFNKEDANKQAMQALILIQGSLVVSKTMDTTVPFLNTLKTIELLFIKTD